MRPHGTILIVDDDPNDRFLIEAALRTTGTSCDFRVLRDGAEAIAYLKGEGEFADRRQHPYPILLITDLKMPGVDGLEVLEYLKNKPRASIVPTVVLSSSGDPDDIEKAYSLGATCYHVKPISAEGLRKQLCLLHEYWMSCEVPGVDPDGNRSRTNTRARIGERYSKDPPPEENPS